MTSFRGDLPLETPAKRPFSNSSGPAKITSRPARGVFANSPTDTRTRRCSGNSPLIGKATNRHQGHLRLATGRWESGKARPGSAMVTTAKNRLPSPRLAGRVRCVHGIVCLRDSDCPKLRQARDPRPVPPSIDCSHRPSRTESEQKLAIAGIRNDLVDAVSAPAHDASTHPSLASRVRAPYPSVRTGPQDRLGAWAEDEAPDA
jgi:hypothetical protein